MKLRLFEQNEFIDKLALVVIQLLKEMQIKHNPAVVAEAIKRHPNSPSLLTIVEVLRSWGIPCDAFVADQGGLAELHFPSIAQLESNDFVVLLKTENNMVHYLDPAKGKCKAALDEFAKIWSGKIIEPGSPSILSNELSNKTKNPNFTLSMAVALGGCLFLMILAFAFFSVCNPLLWSVLMLVKISCLLFSFILVTPYLTGASLIQKLCPPKEDVNCLQVLHSPAGKIFGMSMGDIGMVVFGGGLVSLLLMPFAKEQVNFLVILAYISMASIPYSIFSVVYQRFVVKKWCVFCLVVQLMIWIEVALFLVFKVPIFSSPLLYLALPPLVQILGGFLFAAASWLIVREFIKKENNLRKFNSAWYRTIKKPDYIKYQISSGDSFDVQPFQNEIIFGPPSSPARITLVIAPGCGFCHRALRKFRSLLSVNGGRFCLAVRFLSAPIKPEDKWGDLNFSQQVVYNILGLSQEGKHPLALEALLSWFGSSNTLPINELFEKWQAQYCSAYTRQPSLDLSFYEKHVSWALADSNKIHGTPTIFVGDKVVPERLSYEDIVYYLLRI